MLNLLRPLLLCVLLTPPTVSADMAVLVVIDEQTVSVARVEKDDVETDSIEPDSIELDYSEPDYSEPDYSEPDYSEPDSIETDIEAGSVDEVQSQQASTEELVQEMSTSVMPLPETLPENSDKLLVRWYNADGELIHHEVLRDPRFVHAPGSAEMRLPEATLLLRAPNKATLLRIKPRDFGGFVDLPV